MNYVTKPCSRKARHIKFDIQKHRCPTHECNKHVLNNNNTKENRKVSYTVPVVYTL